MGGERGEEIVVKILVLGKERRVLVENLYGGQAMGVYRLVIRAIE